MNEDNDTAIKYAVKSNNVLVLHELLSHHRALVVAHQLPPHVSESIDIVGADGDTPLLAACRNESIGCLMVCCRDGMMMM